MKKHLIVLCSMALIAQYSNVLSVSKGKEVVDENEVSAAALILFNISNGNNNNSTNSTEQTSENSNEKTPERKNAKKRSYQEYDKSQEIKVCPGAPRRTKKVKIRKTPNAALMRRLTF